MSLIQQVAAAVIERGRASADDIQIEGKSRDQVIRALQNAAHCGLVHSVECRSAGQHKGRAPNVYEKGPGTEPAPVEPQAEPPRGKYGIGRVSSVWELGGRDNSEEARAN